MVWHTYNGKLRYHWFTWWLNTCSMPTHYLSQWCLLVNWTIENKFQWNVNQIATIKNRNEFENVCKKFTILCWLYTVYHYGCYFWQGKVTFAYTPPSQLQLWHWNNVWLHIYLIFMVILGPIWLTHWGRGKMADISDIFKCIFSNDNAWIPLKISLKFVPMVWINNIPTLVQIMAWWRPGDKPLSEPMMVSLLTHVCITRPQWVKLEADLEVWKKYQIWIQFHANNYEICFSFIKILTNLNKFIKTNFYENIRFFHIYFP